MERRPSEAVQDIDVERQMGGEERGEGVQGPVDTRVVEDRQAVGVVLVHIRE